MLLLSSFVNLDFIIFARSLKSRFIAYFDSRMTLCISDTFWEIWLLNTEKCSESSFQDIRSTFDGYLPQCSMTFDQKPTSPPPYCGRSESVYPGIVSFHGGGVLDQNDIAATGWPDRCSGDRLGSTSTPQSEVMNDLESHQLYYSFSKHREFSNQSGQQNSRSGSGTRSLSSMSGSDPIPWRDSWSRVLGYSMSSNRHRQRVFSASCSLFRLYHKFCLVQ